jgi:hypothetical protein
MNRKDRRAHAARARRGEESSSMSICSRPIPPCPECGAPSTREIALVNDDTGDVEGPSAFACEEHAKTLSERFGAEFVAAMRKDGFEVEPR